MSIGVGSQVIVLLLTFLSRTVFIKVLGAEYLGVNGLYTNILTVLSLTELGIGNVMIYSLYKPVAEKDEATIRALLTYYKNIYRKIAIAVLIIGVGFIPLLDKVVKSNLPYTSLVLYYILFLFNSVASYFVVYKTALINADQKIYIIKVIYTLVIFLKELAQILILLTTKSYVLYLIILITSTVLNNIFISVKADKLYPFIKLPNTLTKKEIRKINENIKSTFLYKIGVVIMNNTDNILISIISGTIYVGYYSNYNLLVTAVTTFIGISIQALFSSIGNLNAKRDMLKSYKIFNSLLLFFHWLSAVCSLSFLLVFNDFITIWIGKNYLLGTDVVIAIVIMFYIQNIINPVWIYRETMGLFNQVKYIMIYASIINLTLSIVLGVYWGLAGILISTAIGRILTTVWYEPKLLYRTKFRQPIRNYWIRQLKYFIISIVAACVAILITSDMPISLPFVMLKIVVGFIVMSVSFFVASYKSEEFIVLHRHVLQFIKR
jgi:O-antigen/teichoic acid export membrane protein